MEFISLSVHDDDHIDILNGHVTLLFGEVIFFLHVSQSKLVEDHAFVTSHLTNSRLLTYYITFHSLLLLCKICGSIYIS